MGFGGLGPWEILLIFLVVLLLFGAKRLPEIGSSLGKGIREFKGSLREIENEIKTPMDAPPRRSGDLESRGPEGAEDQPRRLTSAPLDRPEPRKQVEQAGEAGPEDTRD
jgi:sec-independent protein translocase protein TatA